MRRFNWFLLLLVGLATVGLVAQLTLPDPAKTRFPVWSNDLRDYIYPYPAADQIGFRPRALGGIEWYVKFPPAPSTVSIPLLFREQMTWQPGQVDFVLSKQPDARQPVLLYINGGLRDAPFYTVSGTKVHFNSQPWWLMESGGDRIEFVYYYVPTVP